jgi:surfeit locus 1 family protein
MPFPALQIGAFRFRPSLWPTLAFVLLFPLLLGLGAWQIDRAAAKQALVDQRAQSEVHAPIDLNTASALTEADRYRPATVTGRYDPQQHWLLDNRVFQGQPGYHVFTRFVPADGDGSTLLVNRGWVAVGASREFLPRLPVPEGRVTLRGRLDKPASVGMVMGEPPLQSVESRVVVLSLDIAALARAKGMDLMRFALVIDDGEPGGLQYDWSPIPRMGPEKHLGYAVQWFGLAVALLIIFIGVNTRRAGDDGDEHAST